MAANNAEGKIIKVAGPLVVAEGMSGANMYDVVRVGKSRLIGEIIDVISHVYNQLIRNEPLLHQIQ